MATYTIKEDGKNGTVTVYEDRIIRVIKKTMRKDDIQTIPIRSIDGVYHNRKTVKSDIVTLNVNARSFEWKTKAAEALVAEIHEAMYAK